MTSVQIGDKIYSSDPFSGWEYYFQTQSNLQKCIENGDVASAIIYSSDPKLIDHETCLGITSLFMMLQYSVIVDFSPAIKNLVEKKFEMNTSFDSFKKNMDLAKNHGDYYVESLKTKLKNTIGDEKYNKIFF